MIIDGIVLYPILTAVTFYLLSRAVIMQPIHALIAAIRLAHVADCAACSGFWYGLVFGASGAVLHVPFLGLTATWQLYAVVPLIGFMSIWWTPLFAALQDKAMEQLGRTVPDPEASDGGDAAP
jgi:hypothetical protein